MMTTTTTTTTTAPPPASSAAEEMTEELFRAYRNLQADLRRAGYDDNNNAGDADNDDDARLRENIRLELSAGREKYDATPTRIDILAVPKHRADLRAPGACGRLGDDAPMWNVGGGHDPRENGIERFLVDTEVEIPPRIYVHFACFPAHVFKHQQMIAALNNLREQRGITSRDTVVFVTVRSASTAKLEMSKHAAAVTYSEFRGREGQYIIQFLLAELQFDLQAHTLVPPTRVLHCQREIRDKLAAVAHVLSPERELAIFSAKDPHMRRLFARPGDIIEALVTSETDVARPYYGIVRLSETVHVP